MNGAKKHIKIAQGIATKVYRFYDNDHCTRVEVIHAKVKPIIFRNIHHSNSKMSVIKYNNNEVPKIVSTVLC